MYIGAVLCGFGSTNVVVLSSERSDENSTKQRIEVKAIGTGYASSVNATPSGKSQRAASVNAQRGHSNNATNFFDILTNIKNCTLHRK